MQANLSNALVHLRGCVALRQACFGMGNAVLAEPPVLVALAAALRTHQRAVSLHVVAFRLLARNGTQVITEEVTTAVMLTLASRLAR